MYDLFWAKPPPLVERRLRFEVAERMAADGTVVKAAGRRRGARARRSPAGARDRLGRGLLPPLLPLPRARGARRRDPGRGASRGDGLALERDPARAARVRALGDDGRQRLRAPADVVVHRPDPHRPRRDRAGGRPARDHAVVGRRDDLRRRQAAPRLRARVGAGGGRRRCARHGAGGSGSRTRSRSTWAARPPRRP